MGKRQKKEEEPLESWMGILKVYPIFLAPTQLLLIWAFLFLFLEFNLFCLRTRHFLLKIGFHRTFLKNSSHLLLFIRNLGIFFYFWQLVKEFAKNIWKKIEENRK